MNEGMVTIIVALIGLLGTVITAFLVPLLKEKLTKERRVKLHHSIMTAVLAAEQIFNQPGMGDRKKDYVIDYLMSKNINITREDLNIFIEAAVNEMNNMVEVALE